jgi:catechol 2,3-dioxygenase-like lactoylglutathione lyase family enzyme
VDAKTLDHVALWVAERDSIVEFLVGTLELHVIERTDAFTLVGSDARRGKITLFAAEGPRERGALRHVALRVRDVERFGGEAAFDLDEGLRIVLVEGSTDVEYDLDHVALYSRDPAKAAEEYLSLGFEPAAPGRHGPRVHVGGAHVEFHRGDPGSPERPLLNHLAVLVDSADEQHADAVELGLDVADFVDAANTRALFVWGPERVKIEYVEHKPTFSLA